MPISTEQSKKVLQRYIDIYNKGIDAIASTQTVEELMTEKKNLLLRLAGAIPIGFVDDYEGAKEKKNELLVAIARYYHGEKYNLEFDIDIRRAIVFELIDSRRHVLSASTGESLMFLIGVLPLSATECYFCLLYNLIENYSACKDEPCAYGQIHGRCSNAVGTDYGCIINILDELETFFITSELTRLI